MGSVANCPGAGGRGGGGGGGEGVGCGGVGCGGVGCGCDYPCGGGSSFRD